MGVRVAGGCAYRLLVPGNGQDRTRERRDTQLGPGAYGYSNQPNYGYIWTWMSKPELLLVTHLNQSAGVEFPELT